MALIENWDQAEKAMKTAMDSEGSAVKENEKYLDSIEGKIASVKQSMQDMWSNTLDTSIVKGFIDLGGALVNIADKINPITIALGLFATYMGKFAGKESGMKTFLTGITDGFVNLISKIGPVGKAIDSLKDKMSGMSSGWQALFGGIKAAAPLVAFTAIAAGIGLIEKQMQKVKERYRDAQNSIEEYNSTLEKNRDLINTDGATFEKLSKGVDTSTGENIALSTSEYEEYNRIVNEIASAFPSLIAGHTANGDALLKEGTSVKELNNAYAELKEQYNKQTVAKTNDFVEGYKQDTKDTRSVYNLADNLMFNKQIASRDGYEYTAEDIKNTLTKGTHRSTVKELMKDAGLNYKFDMDENAKTIEENFDKIITVLDSSQAELEQKGSVFKEILQSSIELDNDWDNISEKNQQRVTDMISNMGYDQLETFLNAGDTNKAIENFQNGVYDLFKNPGTSGTVETIFDKISKFSESGDAAKAASEIEGLVKSLEGNKNIDRGVLKSLKELWGINENGNFTYLGKDITKMYDQVEKSLYNIGNNNPINNKTIDNNKKLVSSLKGAKKGSEEYAKSYDKISEAAEKAGMSTKEFLSVYDSSGDYSDFLSDLDPSELSTAYDILCGSTTKFTGTLDQLKERIRLIKKANLASTFSDWQIATQSANAGSDYTTMTQGWKDTKDLRDKGLIGTDDFTTFTSMMTGGKTSAEAFDKAYNNMKKYFTTDLSGPQKFLDMLATKTNENGTAMAKYNEETEKWKINIDDLNKLSKSTGMGIAPLEAILGRLKDYGFDVEFDSIIQSYEDATSKVDELQGVWEDMEPGSSKIALGEDIEEYRQAIINYQKANESIPDHLIKELEFKITVSAKQSELDSLEALYKQQLAEGDIEGAKNTGKSLQTKGQEASSNYQTAATESLGKNEVFNNNYHKKEQEYLKQVKDANDEFTDACKKGNKERMESSEKALESARDSLNNFYQDAAKNSDKYTTKIKTKNIKDLKKTLNNIDSDLDLNGNKEKGYSIKLNADDTEALRAIHTFNQKHSNEQITVKIDADAEEAEQIIKDLRNENPDSVVVEVDAEIADAVGELEGVEMMQIGDKQVAIIARDSEAMETIKKVDGIELNDKETKLKCKDKATATINSVNNKLKSLDGKTANTTITTNHRDVYTKVYKTEGSHEIHSWAYSGSNSNGTAHAIGTALSNGTASILTGWNYYRGSNNAYAEGNWALQNDETALVNELGKETIVRNGRYHVIEGGAQFTQLKKGDIVFNHKQTEELFKYGYVTSNGGRGRLIGGSYANGTATTGPAHSGTRVTGSGPDLSKYSNSSSKSSSSSSKKSSSSSKSSSSKSSSKSRSSSSSDKKTKLEKTLEELTKRFDWVEIRLKRLGEATQRVADKITDYVSSAFKASQLKKQMSAVQKEISANQSGYSEYMSEANRVREKTKKSAKNSKDRKLLETYYSRVRNGKIDITTVPERLKDAVTTYQQYYEAAISCKDAVQELKNQQLELFEQWANIPIERAEKAIERLKVKYKNFNKEILDSQATTASSGGSAIAQLIELQRGELESAEKKYNDAKSKREKAQKENNTAQTAKKKARDAYKKSGTVTSNKKSVTSALKKAGKLTKSKQKAIKEGKTISTKGLKGSAKKAAEKYNKSVANKKKLASATEKANKTSTSLSSAKSAEQRAYDAYDRAQRDSELALDNEGASSYSYQNDLLDQQLAVKREEYAEYKKSYDEATKNRKTYERQRDAARDKRDKQANSLLKKYKFTEAQKKALKEGKTISTKGMSGKKLKAVQEYNKAVAAATTAQQKYNIALDAQTEAGENARIAQAELAQQITETAKSQFENVQNYYEANISYLEKLTDAYEKASEVKKAMGESLGEQDYLDRLNAKEDERNALIAEQTALRRRLNMAVASGAIVENTEEWWEMQNAIADVTSQIADCDIAMEELKDEMRTEVLYREFNKALQASEDLRGEMETIASLIDEDMMYDDNGVLTDYGKAALAAEAKQLESYEKDLEAYIQHKADLQKWAEDPEKYGLSSSELEEEIRQNEQNIQSTLKNMKSARDEVLNIIKSQAKAELDAINKVIDARKEALQKKEDYYDYDKNLRNQKKEIDALKAEIAALDGVSDAESRAQKARLEAQLAEAEEDFQDTIRDHIVSLQIEGLDDLKTELSEDYDNYVKELSRNLDLITEIMNGVSDSIAESADSIASAISQILKAYGIDDPSDLNDPDKGNNNSSNSSGSTGNTTENATGKNNSHNVNGGGTIQKFATGGTVTLSGVPNNHGLALVGKNEEVVVPDVVKTLGEELLPELKENILPTLQKLSKDQNLQSLSNMALSNIKPLSTLSSYAPEVKISFDIDGIPDDKALKEMRKIAEQMGRDVMNEISQDAAKIGLKRRIR